VDRIRPYSRNLLQKVRARLWNILLPRTYSPNQTGAIACGFAAALWALTADAVAIMVSRSSSIYMVFIVVFWLLLPFYIKLVRRAFMLGIFCTATGLAYLLVTPSLLGTAYWYNFERGLFDFTYVVAYLIGFASIYFNYRSWKELLTK